jgi:hypothetical protein|nr:hypothetical protein [Kofleriaceae bacterium]
MRLSALAVLVLAGCGPSATPCQDCFVDAAVSMPPTEPGSCTDTSCGTGNVCANDGSCYPASEIRVLHVTWTVGGQPANATTCATEPDLMLDMTSTSDPDVPGDFGEGWAPVPCQEGEFSFQKMPALYDGAELDPYGAGTATARGAFDGSGDVALDLE